MNRKYSPEIRERAVRMVAEHQDEYSSQWEAIGSIAEKIRLFLRDFEEVGAADRGR